MDDGKLEPLELAAKAQFEKLRGRAMSDEEWRAAKDRLLGFVRLMQQWERNEAKEHP